MAKKGRKAVLQKSAKAIYAKKAGRHDRGRSRPGRPDGGVSAIANSLKRKGSEAKKKQKMNLGGAAGTGQAAVAAAQPAAGISSNANKIPFSSDDLILVVGDGNFSFSSALATRLGDAEMIIASAFDSEAEVERKYPDSAVHTASVLDLGGKILFGVDATKLESCPDLKGSRSRFSKIVFNFPHAGAGIKDQAHNTLTNQRLLAGFFASARSFLSSPLSGPLYSSKGPITPQAGQVLITLKSGLPYDEWGIVEIAKLAGYYVHSCTEFRPEQYPGYEHRRTIGWDETKEDNVELDGKACKTWTFMDKKAAGAAAAARKVVFKKERKKGHLDRSEEFKKDRRKHKLQEGERRGKKLRGGNESSSDDSD